MRLPFTQADFLDVFGAYNQALWPVALALWLASVAAVIQLLREKLGTRAAVGLLVVHWVWSGVVYHWMYFARINPAARLFAVAFAAEAALLWWYGGARHGLTFDSGRLPRHLVGGVLVVYALIYPGLALLTGHTWPRVPLFAVPCPTTLLTAGFLLFLRPPVPRALAVVPVLWTVVGGSAAVLLSMTPDLMLSIAGVVMVFNALRGAEGKA